MRLLILLLLSTPVYSQDTLKLSGTKEKILAQLLEKGYTIDTKTDSLIVTNGMNSYKNNSFKIYVRLKIHFTNNTSYLTGEASHNFRSNPTNRKIDWIPVYNNGKEQSSWIHVKRFADYNNTQQ